MIWFIDTLTTSISHDLNTLNMLDDAKMGTGRRFNQLVRVQNTLQAKK